MEWGQQHVQQHNTVETLQNRVTGFANNFCHKFKFMGQKSTGYKGSSTWSERCQDLPKVIPDARNNREDPERSARYGLFKRLDLQAQFQVPKVQTLTSKFPIACDEDTNDAMGMSKHSIIGRAETTLSPRTWNSNSSPPNSRGVETWNRRRRDLPLAILVARGDGDPALSDLQKRWSQSSTLPRSDLHAVPKPG